MRRRLLNILRRIGRWVFDELLAVGATALADYMLVRSRKFLRDAKTSKHAQWLRARARRWKKASEWIRGSGTAAAREVTREIVDAIPYLSAYETVE